ncbi:MAG TPA: hypothetical protein VMH32_11945 [Burkholderiales bacterium]|nr:hypothetical protein [Burkholderiales bacterium]
MSRASISRAACVERRGLKLLTSIGYLIAEQGVRYLAEGEGESIGPKRPDRILKLPSIRLSPEADDPAWPALA